MGLMIAAGVMGAAGLAGGIMGGAQKAAEQEAAFMAEKMETERNNFLGQLANDRQTEATAQANVNQRIQDRKIYESALSNQFYADWQNRKQTADAENQVTQSARAAQATLMSQVTGQQGGASGGTAEAMKRQQARAARDRMHQVNVKNYETEKSIVQEFDNALGQQSKGLGDQYASAFIPGSTGVKPSSSGAMTAGIMGGLSGGLGMASGVMGLGA